MGAAARPLNVSIIANGENAMAYGDKRDYPEIEIFHKSGGKTWSYVCTTTWSRTCREAKERFLDWHGNLKKEHVKASFKR